MEKQEQELEGGLEVLEADLAETENSVYHLVRSNVELAQFLEETSGDQDLEQALEENKLALVKKRHRIKALRNAISDLKAQRPHLAATAAVSSTPAAPPGVDAEHDDTISTMTASMNLGVQLTPSRAGGAAGDVSESGSAAVAAAEDPTPHPVRSGQQGEAGGVTMAREGGEVDVGADYRGGVML
eukprot:g5720.t1